MQKKLIKISSLFLLMVMTFMLCSFTVAAEGSKAASESRTVTKNYLSVSGIRTKTVSSYSPVSVYVNGKAAGYSGRLISGTVYIPIRRFVENNTSASVSFASASRTLSVSGAGHSMSVSDGAYVLYASGRPIFSMTPSVILSDGYMYVPVGTLSKAFGLGSWQSGSSVYIW